jgi:acetolactate synthase-1/3 small subunit
MPQSKTNPIETRFQHEGIHTISLMVANKPGVLLRICLVFSRRGYNIESLVVSPAFDGRFSRMTITAQGDHSTLEQIIKQCSKLIDVVQAGEHDPLNSVEREFALVNVTLTKEDRIEILQLVQHFHADTVDMGETELIFQIVGSTDHLNTCISMFKPFGIKEIHVFK